MEVQRNSGERRGGQEGREMVDRTGKEGQVGGLRRRGERGIGKKRRGGGGKGGRAEPSGKTPKTMGVLSTEFYREDDKRGWLCVVV